MAQDANGNTIRDKGFTQVCVWPGTMVGTDNINAFIQFVADELGARVQYLEEVFTFPDKNMYGEPVSGTGGRCDLFFAVHSGDIPKFALARLKYGMRWLEDVYGNRQGHLYPKRIVEYKTWDAGLVADDVEEATL